MAVETRCLRQFRVNVSESVTEVSCLSINVELDLQTREFLGPCFALSVDSVEAWLAIDLAVRRLTKRLHHNGLISEQEMLQLIRGLCES